MCVCVCVCVFGRVHLRFSCSSIPPSMEEDVCVRVCVYIYINFGHFGGLSNTNMTRTQRECGICAVLFRPHWDTAGFYSLFDECVTLLSVRYRARALWGLASCWRLLFLICVLCLKHVCSESWEERKKGGGEDGRINSSTVLVIFFLSGFANWHMLCCDSWSVYLCVCVCTCVLRADAVNSSDYEYWSVHLWGQKCTQKRRSMGAIRTIHHGDGCQRSEESQRQPPPEIWNLLNKILSSPNLIKAETKMFWQSLKVKALNRW